MNWSSLPSNAEMSQFRQRNNSQPHQVVCRTGICFPARILDFSHPQSYSKRPKNVKKYVYFDRRLIVLGIFIPFTVSPTRTQVCILILKLPDHIPIADVRKLHLQQYFQLKQKSSSVLKHQEWTTLMLTMQPKTFLYYNIPFGIRLIMLLSEKRNNQKSICGNAQSSIPSSRGVGSLGSVIKIVLGNF